MLTIPLVYDGVKKGRYLIDEDGNVYSCFINDYLKPTVSCRHNKEYLIRLHTGYEKPHPAFIRPTLANVVAYNFIGPPPAELKHPTAIHKDGNVYNNNYTNLEWAEQQFVPPGNVGEENPNAYLWESEVREICYLLQETEMTMPQIARQFEISTSVIKNIAAGTRWKHISKDYDFSCRRVIFGEHGHYKVINTKITPTDVESSVNKHPRSKK